MNQPSASPNFSWRIIVLIMAGEAIFFLPFVLPRVFRPTVLEVFEIDNTQLGSFFSVYGLVAIGAYLIGGPLADRFPAHKLLAGALMSTALGGLFLATYPSLEGMRYVYGFWGFSTICLFWAALFRATRLIFRPDRQGLAFGLLDGGRGLFAALMSGILVVILAFYLPDEADPAFATGKRVAFRNVIWTVTGVVFAIGVLVYFSLKNIDTTGRTKRENPLLKRMAGLVKLPSVWLQAGIILCAYSGYKISDDFSLLAQDALGYTDVEAASVGSFSLWLRPLSAIAAGLLADKVKASNMLLLCFTMLIAAGLLQGIGGFTTYGMIITVIVTTSLAVFAMRGLYFAIMEEGKVPLAVTGTAVGLASIIGYLPDVYMGPLMGYYLDTFPGMEGHQKVFLAMTVFSVVGLLLSIVFKWSSSRKVMPTSLY